MGTGDGGLNGMPVTNHVVTANERGQDHAMTQRQNMTERTVWELTHSIGCVIWWPVLIVSEPSKLCLRILS